MVTIKLENTNDDMWVASLIDANGDLITKTDALIWRGPSSQFSKAIDALIERSQYQFGEVPMFTD